MDSLRFCMITTFYPPHNFGGDGIAIQRLSRALVSRGHDVTVIHDVDAYNLLSGRPEPSAAPDDAGVRVVRLRSRLGPLSPVLTQQSGRPVVHGRHIRRFLDEGNFDVTVFHNVSLVGGPGILSAGRGIKVYEAHEHWLVCPMHVLWRHNREPCTGRACTRCTLTYRRPPQLWRYTRFLKRQLRHVDAFIAKSDFSRDKHREYGFDRPMTVIPYFLPDTGEAAPAVEPAAAARPYFLFVGRLEKIKGLDDVIPAMRSFADVDFVIAGDGTHGPALRRLAEDIPNVRFLGRVGQDRLRALYQGAVALIVPSVGYETFGIILIEAFRQGVPVIARRIGPFPEIVETAGGGLLFQDAGELLAAMRRLHGDPDRRRTLAENARRAFERHWTEAAVMPRYLAAFREAAQRKGDTRVDGALRLENVA